MNVVLGILIIWFLTITSAGCSTPRFHAVQIKEDSFAAEQCKPIGVLYSKSFFQERFAGKYIPMFIVFQPWLAKYMADNASFEKTKSTRLESSDYEKLLGDFDVAEHFSRLFSMNTPKSKYIKIKLAENAEIADQIIRFVQPYKAENKEINHDARRKYSCVAAFKMSYGIGIKLGEHFGFSHTYRPFIRLIGTVKRTDSGEVVWSDSIIAFGSKKYVGSDANADKINKNELISTYKELSKEVVDLTFNSLNGKPLPAMPDQQREWIWGNGRFPPDGEPHAMPEMIWTSKPDLEF